MPVPSASQQPASRSVAVLMGIKEYRNGIPPLRNAVPDVHTVAPVLREEHGYQTHMLLDEQASLSGLWALFSQLPVDLPSTCRG